MNGLTWIIKEVNWQRDKETGELELDVTLRLVEAKGRTAGPAAELMGALQEKAEYRLERAGS